MSPAWVKPGFYVHCIVCSNIYTVMHLCWLQSEILLVDDNLCKKVEIQLCFI